MKVDINRIYGDVFNSRLVDTLAIRQGRVFWVRQGVNILRKLSLAQNIVRHAFDLTWDK